MVRVCRAHQEKIKVMLDGQGADEQLSAITVGSPFTLPACSDVLDTPCWRVLSSSGDDTTEYQLQSNSEVP